MNCVFFSNFHCNKKIAFKRMMLKTVDVLSHHTCKKRFHNDAVNRSCFILSCCSCHVPRPLADFNNGVGRPYPDRWLLFSSAVPILNTKYRVHRKWFTKNYLLNWCNSRNIELEFPQRSLMHLLNIFHH